MTQIKYCPSTDKLGKAVVKYFRDENYQNYLDTKKCVFNTGINKYINQINSTTMADEFKILDIERAKLYSELTKEQNEVLDRLVLSLLDGVAFNVMRALEENNATEENFKKENGIKLKVDGKNIEDLELIGGTLFHEIFDWYPRFSKFGQYQH